jgi:hypothetical protein
MNVFEDLVVELKEENLLEDTVMDTERAAAAAAAADAIDITDEPNPVDIIADVAEAEIASETPAHAPKKLRYGREFFNKRAVAEVSSLQMVEHVLTGVEREYLKIIPKAFDDFNAKKALNTFLQMPDSSNTEEHKRAEFDLMQETEAWASALGDRDRGIPVSNLRQYCENSKPALSSQALLALGRFYRNSAYSEAVRAKFDFLITRLFSRAGDDGSRVLLFARDEMLEHITKLYADWSSVPLYTADADESNVLLTALSFEDLANEADQASHFDQLIKSDFFSRLRLFKESISELFYAPNVTAAAIDCNIRIGNAYVKLIEAEQKKMDAQSIQAKYGDLNDQSVSDAAAWTLDLAEIIRHRAETARVEVERAAEQEGPPPPPVAAVPSPPAPAKIKEKNPGSGLGAKAKAQLAAINRWVIVSCALLLIASGGLWVWANYYAGEDVPSVGVRGVTLDGTQLSDHIKTAKVSGDTFYGLLKESWDALPKDKRTEFVQKCLAFATQQGAKQVQLIDRSGRQAAYASAIRSDVNMP